MLARTGRGIARHPLPVLLAWVVLVVVGGGAALGLLGGQGLFDRLTNSSTQVAGEARDGDRLLAARAPDARHVLLQVDGVDPGSAALQGALVPGLAALRGLDGVAEAAGPVAGGGPAADALRGTDGRSVLVTVTLARGLARDAADAAASRAGDRLRRLGTQLAGSAPGATARVSSVEALVDDINAQVESDLHTGEAVALPLSLVVMLLVFGGFLAAAIPVVGAVATIAGGLAVLLGYSHLTDLDSSVVNVVTVLGLGLCIDYGLLVVSRYREELRALAAAGRSVAGPAVRGLALERTMATAGRTVVFSAVTVAVSLSGLLVFSADILRSMGVAAVSVVLVALLVALTLVPALLVLAGARLAGPGATTRVPLLGPLARRLGDVAPEEGRFSAVARAVQRRPWAVVAVVTAVLALAASPVLSLQLRSDGITLLPVDHPARTFFTDLDHHFPVTSSPAVTVVAHAPVEQVQAYARRVAALPGVASVDPPTPVGDLVRLGVRVDGDPLGSGVRDLVGRMRADRPAFATWVTGDAAEVVDFTADLSARAPYAAALVVLTTLVLLFALTGSVLVPVKALAVNVLSLGACLGAVVWVFQDGHLTGLLGFTPTGGVETFVPPLALALGFGLAMDYEVFLLSRVLDAHRAGARTDAAVVLGLQRSGRIITSAALIIVVVFAGFVSGHLLVIKEVGLALAVAVAVDATLVRVLLVPAVMTLLGEVNWWAPAPLRRLHERFGVDEHAAAPGRTNSGRARARPTDVPSGGDAPVPSR